MLWSSKPAPGLAPDDGTITRRRSWRDGNIRGNSRGFRPPRSGNIRRYMGETPNLEIRIRDIYESIDVQSVDRIVLDLSEPWRIVDDFAKALRPGVYFASYLPTMLQVKRLVDTLSHHGGLRSADTVEILERHWHVANT